MKKIGIKDVAKEANVSISTVSRVFRKYGNVPKDTENSVLEAAKKLQYTPNIAAQALRGSLNNIGIVFTRLAEDAFINPFYSEVLRGISTIIKKENHYMQIIACDTLEEEKAEIRTLLASGRVDGIILLYSRCMDPLIYDLVKNESNFIISGRVESDHLLKDKIYTVNTDSIKDTYDAVSVLINKGHKKIALINEESNYIVNLDRMNGYKQALISNGIEFDEDLIIIKTKNNRETVNNIKNKLKKHPEISAIFAKDDLIAAYAYEAIKEMGLNIPQDIAVMGHNDLYLASLLEPKLSTVRVPIFELGCKLAENLIKIINKEEIDERHVVLPTELIIRESI